MFYNFLPANFSYCFCSIYSLSSFKTSITFTITFYSFFIHFLYSQAVFPIKIRIDVHPSHLLIGLSTFYFSQSMFHGPASSFYLSPYLLNRSIVFLPRKQYLIPEYGVGRRKVEREQNRAEHPFSLNKITRHPVNTKPFNELPRSVVTAQGHAGKHGRPPGTSCAERSSKVQHPASSHQRYFLATADLQVSFEALKTPDPF